MRFDTGCWQHTHQSRAALSSKYHLVSPAVHVNVFSILETKWNGIKQNESDLWYLLYGGFQQVHWQERCCVYMSNCVSSHGNCTHVTRGRDLSLTHTWSLFAYGVPWTRLVTSNTMRGSSSTAITFFTTSSSFIVKFPAQWRSGHSASRRVDPALQNRFTHGASWLDQSYDEMFSSSAWGNMVENLMVIYPPIFPGLGSLSTYPLQEHSLLKITMQNKQYLIHNPQQQSPSLQPLTALWSNS